MIVDVLGLEYLTHVDHGLFLAGKRLSGFAPLSLAGQVVLSCLDFKYSVAAQIQTQIGLEKVNYLLNKAFVF